MMSIPFLDLRKINLEIDQEIRIAIDKVIDSGWYIMGNELVNFEHEMKKHLVPDQEGYVIGCNSGTDAIVLSLLAAGVKSGDEVITVSHTAIPTIAAIVGIGATPIFIDIDDKTWVMDVEKVYNKISAKTKAIIAVHLYGNMVDVFSLKDIITGCNREDIAIIEDVAQAQGAYLNGCQAGTIGDFGAFSFYPSKNIGALGDGGAVFCKNEDKYELLCMLRNYGQKDRYSAIMPHGLNSRLDEVQASILTVKIKYLSDWNERKNKIMQYYRDELLESDFEFQDVTDNCKPGWHLCVIAFPNESKRDNAIQMLKEAGVHTLIHYPTPTHMQKAFSTFNEKKNDLQNTESLAKRILSIPFNTILADNEKNYIVDVLKKI